MVSSEQHFRRSRRLNCMHVHLYILGNAHQVDAEHNMLVFLQCQPCKRFWACCGQSNFPPVLDLLGWTPSRSCGCMCHLSINLQSQGEHLSYVSGVCLCPDLTWLCLCLGDVFQCDVRVCTGQCVYHRDRTCSQPPLVQFVTRSCIGYDHR